MVTQWDISTCETVHAATLRVLRETGVEVRHEAACKMLASAGVEVSGTRVRMDANIVNGALSSVARNSVLHMRGGDGDVTLKDGNLYYGTGSDCLYYRDPHGRERRRVRMPDIEAMAGVVERLPNLDFVMSMGLPEDVPALVDDLAPFAAMLASTRKPLLVAPRTAQYLSLMQEMAGLAGETKSFAIYGMPAPPLVHSYEAVEKLMGCASRAIPIVYGPAAVAGATGPCSIAGVTLVSNAEVLSGLVIHQLAGAGSPFVYGANAYGIDMRTGTAIYVAPESFAGQFLGCDLARHYGLPSFGYAGCSDSKILDEQWSLEAAITVIMATLARATLLHDVGYLEAGLQSSCESIVLGDELAGFARAAVREVSANEEELTLALDELAAVGPGGDFLGRPLTRQRARKWWHSSLFDELVHDRWVADGSLSLGARVQAKTAAVRADFGYVVDSAIRDRLDEMVAGALAAHV